MGRRKVEGWVQRNSVLTILARCMYALTLKIYNNKCLVDPLDRTLGIGWGSVGWLAGWLKLEMKKPFSRNGNGEEV